MDEVVVYAFWETFVGADEVEGGGVGAGRGPAGIAEEG